MKNMNVRARFRHCKSCQACGEQDQSLARFFSCRCVWLPVAKLSEQLPASTPLVQGWGRF